VPRLSVFLILILAGNVFAQQVRLGVKGGVRTGSEYEFVSSEESRRYTVGPSFELALPLIGLRFEADALYSRLGYTKIWSDIGGFSVRRSRTNSWEFPLLAKRTLPIPIVRPFVIGGYAPRITREEGVSTGYLASFEIGRPATPYNRKVPAESRWTHGLVAGGGVETGVGRIRLSPEVRYTRWNQPATDVISSQGYRIRSNQNQLQILLGISWKVR
jgi:hypothetical protein